MPNSHFVSLPVIKGMKIGSLGSFVMQMGCSAMRNACRSNGEFSQANGMGGVRLSARSTLADIALGPTL